jgi:hypothetical protein
MRADEARVTTGAMRICISVRQTVLSRKSKSAAVLNAARLLMAVKVPVGPPSAHN